MVNMDSTSREKYMRFAIDLAEEAASSDEVPVGCVITDEHGNIIGRGRNRCIEKHDATAHAEMEAIREASTFRGDWRLDGCTLFVTMEPCPMCTGAIMNSRIRRVVYGAKDDVKGACGSVIDLFSEHFPDKAAVFGNVLQEDCSRVLNNFFSKVRKEKDC